MSNTAALTTTAETREFRLFEEAKLLTRREKECLQLVSYGKTSIEIAIILGLSRFTVESHVKKAIRKLGASCRVHAVANAIRRNVID